MDEAEILKRLSISRDDIVETIGSTCFNETLSEYFFRLYDEYSVFSALSESQRVLECSNIWLCDHYEKTNVSDVKYVSHCRSRFCLTCQKLLQASRLNRYFPILMDSAKDYDLYHLVLSIPNVTGVKLKAAIKLMGISFKRLIIFLSGRKSIRGIDFKQYGFYACLRALEVTYHTKFLKDGTVIDDDFHPHYHCVLALKKGLVFNKTETNAYSYDEGVFKRNFSAFEILIQKLWRLIVDSERKKVYQAVAHTDKLGKPLSKNDPIYETFDSIPKKKSKKEDVITLSAIENLKIGYSCVLDYIEPDEDNMNLYEVFKYTFKVTSEEQTFFSYNQFVALYFSLYKVKGIQGYGAWSRLKGDDAFDDDIDDFYNIFIGYLRHTELPYVKNYDLKEVLAAIDNSATIFFTKKSLVKWLKRSDAPSIKDFSVSLGNPTPCSEREPKRFHIADFTTAFYRFLFVKRTSDLFKDIREQERRAKEESKSLALTPQQLTFLNGIFL